MMSTKNLDIARANISKDPFIILKRKTDKAALNSIRYPVNPLICRSPELLPNQTEVIPLQLFCRIRNIPFCQNEHRFYKIVKNKVESEVYKSAVNTYANLVQ
jgi:hypothetical protein